VVITAAATALELALRPSSYVAPFLLHYAAAVVAAFAAGMAPGLLSVALSAASCAWCSSTPTGGAAPGPPRVVEVVLFIVAASVLVAMAAALRSSRAALRQSEARWRAVVDESESARAEAIAARDQFLTIASHELRTPLAAAQLQIQSLRRFLEREAQPDAVRVLEPRIAATAATVERLGALVDALLDVSRIVTGRLELERQSYDLSEAVCAAIARFSDAARRAGSTLTVDAAPGIWARGDRLRVEQVLASLLSNAIKYGQREPIAVALRRAGDRAVISVEDHGVGIAPEVQARVFERFERAGAPSQYGGLGLRLWIARHVVTASGGSIRLESAPGRGSTFTVELPADAVALTSGERATAGTRAIRSIGV
jgi:signal transduction histidine kinase